MTSASCTLEEKLWEIAGRLRWMTMLDGVEVDRSGEAQWVEG